MSWFQYDELVRNGASVEDLVRARGEMMTAIRGKKVHIRIEYPSPEFYLVLPVELETDDAEEAIRFLFNSLYEWCIDDDLTVLINHERVWPQNPEVE